MPDNFFSGVVVWQDGPEGPEYLVLDYEERGEIQVKFPGGVGKPGETPLKAAHREMFAEVFLRMLKDPVLVHSSEPVLNDEGDGLHQKHFFLIHIKDCVGELRKKHILDGPNWLSPPFWASEKKLRDGRDKLFYTHLPALDRITARIAA